jgi:hypothetical protein
LARPIPATWGIACIDEANAVLRGEFRLFSDRMIMTGFPPDWHRNQMADNKGQASDAEHSTAENSLQIGEERRRTQEGIGRENAQEGTSAANRERKAKDVCRGTESGRQRVDWATRHWTEISDAGVGDIKGVWELSRFPWAFALARAYARAHDKRYADAFWQLFDDWCLRNPPNLGPNWMCGQEATFRLMAVVFAVEVMGVPEAQRETLARFVLATGRRIAANLGYALSQKNNHGVSECVGLITAALLAPDHDESAGWLTRGLRELAAQVTELVYEDGAFSQHSLIYHRVLLHDLSWCRCRLSLGGQCSPRWLDVAGQRALDFLMTLTDPASGQAPLYGANDGANVLPLADGDFLDLRPTIQATAAVFRAELPLAEGPWDEAAYWLAADWTGLKRGKWANGPVRWHARVGGCFQMTSGRSRLFFRCPEVFRHRPGQADMLHVDIWRDCRPIAHDGGTFSYNSPERFTALSAAAHHNVLTVDDREPLQKFSRFLYLPWPRGTAGDRDGEFAANHNGYAELEVTWIRTVSSPRESVFEVKDSIRSNAWHRYRLHWRLCSHDWRLAADGASVWANFEGKPYSVSWRSTAAPLRVRLLRTDENSAYGWWSPCYGTVEAAVSLVIDIESAESFEILTVFEETKTRSPIPFSQNGKPNPSG